MKSLIFAIAFSFLLFSSCTEKNKASVYKVNYVDHAYINVDGISDEDIWRKAVKLWDFRLPWERNTTPGTMFQALYDTCTLYMNFQAKDQNLIYIDSISNEIDIASEDRVELFLSKNNTMEDYFCIEIDPLGRVLDYRASYYRKFDDIWNVDGILTGSKISSGSYQVEVAIPLNSLEKMGINISKDFYVGLFRADLENSISGLKESWISWIDPGSHNPDFHIPKALGLFHFNQK